MELHPILSAMRRNKVGAIVIVVQTAITLAILCNSLFLIQQRLRSSERPTGLQEQDIFTMANQWVGNPADLAAKAQADLAALRALPEVVDAYASNSYPLSNGGWDDGLSLEAGDAHWVTSGALYFTDEHGLSTLGLKLVAGRNFEPGEITERNDLEGKAPAALIVSQALAVKLFPNGDALGKSIYLGDYKQKAPIIGIVERLQQPWISIRNQKVEYAMLQPYRYVEQYSDYVVRAKPGQLAAAMKSAQRQLMAINRGRINDKTRTMAETRQRAYRDDRGLAIILGVVSVVLLIVTAFGIIGITSFWVSQRRRQIGIRRAMGASRTAILRYFQTENLMIATAGSVLGVLLALTLNFLMAGKFEMARLNVGSTIVAAVIVVLLGQIAVLWPALRAAAISPVVAIRNS
ncbi:MAG TPA: FtsX-like permease family protein [Steroidobacteraceae bacterium]|jgi:putative ABC transport system permease protein|nr:FtsX-like permease family protein [Steroidobacteraceae bacterium]